LYAVDEYAVNRSNQARWHGLATTSSARLAAGSAPAANG